jgi:uncharacterized protein YkwD
MCEAGSVRHPSRWGSSAAIAVSVLAVALLSAFAAPTRAEAINLQRLVAPTSVCPGQNDIDSPKAQLRAMRCLINYARAKSGVRKLKTSGQLNRSATLKANDIKRCGFEHSACGRDFTFWMRKVGYARRCWSGAENIAWGQGVFGSARRIFISWMRSSGHRRNLMAREFNAFGVGLKRGRFQGYSGSQVWATHFGSRC